MSRNSSATNLSNDIPSDVEADRLILHSINPVVESSRKDKDRSRRPAYLAHGEPINVVRLLQAILETMEAGVGRELAQKLHRLINSRVPSLSSPAPDDTPSLLPRMGQEFNAKRGLPSMVRVASKASIRTSSSTQRSSPTREHDQSETDFFPSPGSFDTKIDMPDATVNNLEFEKLRRLILNSRPSRGDRARSSLFNIGNIIYSTLISSTFAILSFDDQQYWSKVLHMAPSGAYLLGATLASTAFGTNYPMAADYLISLKDRILSLRDRLKTCNKTQKFLYSMVVTVAAIMGVSTSFAIYAITKLAFADFKFGDFAPFASDSMKVPVAVLSAFAGANAAVTRTVGTWLPALALIDSLVSRFGPRRDIYTMIRDLKKYGSKVDMSDVSAASELDFLTAFYQRVDKVREPTKKVVLKNILLYGIPLVGGVFGAIAVWGIFHKKSLDGLFDLAGGPKTGWLGTLLDVFAYIGTTAHALFYFNAIRRFGETTQNTAILFHDRFKDYSRAKKVGMGFVAGVSLLALLLSGSGMNEAANNIDNKSFLGIPNANPIAAWVVASLVNTDGFFNYASKHIPQYLKQALPDALKKAVAVGEKVVLKAYQFGKVENVSELKKADSSLENMSDDQICEAVKQAFKNDNAAILEELENQAYLQGLKVLYQEVTRKTNIGSFPKAHDKLIKDVYALYVALNSKDEKKINKVLKVSFGLAGGRASLGQDGDTLNDEIDTHAMQYHKKNAKRDLSQAANDDEARIEAVCYQKQPPILNDNMVRELNNHGQLDAATVERRLSHAVNDDVALARIFPGEGHWRETARSVFGPKPVKAKSSGCGRVLGCFSGLFKRKKPSNSSPNSERTGLLSTAVSGYNSTPPLPGAPDSPANAPRQP